MSGTSLAEQIAAWCWDMLDSNGQRIHVETWQDMVDELGLVNRHQTDRTIALYQKALETAATHMHKLELATTPESETPQ